MLRELLNKEESRTLNVYRLGPRSMNFILDSLLLVSFQPLLHPLSNLVLPSVYLSTLVYLQTKQLWRILQRKVISYEGRRGRLTRSLVFCGMRLG